MKVEPWTSVEGALIPLLGDVAFSEISTMTFTLYAEAKEFLIKRFGKTTT